jgi:hypothetical protein
MDKKTTSQSALAALALCVAAAGQAAPAVASEEIDLQTLQLLREESISEQEFYAAYAKGPQGLSPGGNYSRIGITAGNYSRIGITSNNYSRIGITSSNYSRIGITSGNYSRIGLSGSPMFTEDGSGAALPAPSATFEDEA